KAVFLGPQATLESAGRLLTEVLYPPAGAVSLTKDDDAREDAAWRLEAYFMERPRIDALMALLAETGLGPPAVEELPDIDWVAHALDGLGIVEAGRFVLYGSHDADKLPDDAARIPILIEANQAFGTGHHPTTAGCLALLSRFAGAPPEAVLDLGCGSAVLAIAAAKLWDVEVLASDIDEKSVEIARANIAINGVADLVDAIVADGFADPRIRVRAPYDFVFANILAGPLVDFAPAMAVHVAPRGRAMLAGLMAGQEQDVRAAYEAAGFKLLNRLDHETWPVLLFVRV
ncbi:MAG: 50S ribosomal protein L11 methyltransferase, partial [Parvularculaceae bacterium]|nr:50S ribosomal protein L11 methyltransferase [Parvularculaceae bacterium]